MTSNTSSLLARLSTGEFWRGIAIPLTVALYGTYCIATDTAYLASSERFGNSTRLYLQGHGPLAMGVLCLGVAFAMHSHYFWGRIEPIWRYSMIGVVIGILTALAATVVVLTIAVRQVLA